MSSINSSIITIDDLTVTQIEQILSLATTYHRDKASMQNLIKGKVMVNAFFEPSTRTLLSFTLAAKTLGATTINLTAEHSSLKKGENIEDTLHTIASYQPHCVVIRHPVSGTPAWLNNKLDIPLINAGDGTNEHPTQALIDLLTIVMYKNSSVQGLRIAFCGDVLHSRVAHSNIRLLSRMGARIIVIAPLTLIPQFNKEVEVYTSLEKGLKHADVIIVLRIQHERMKKVFVSSIAEYRHYYCLTEEKLAYAKKDLLIMHAGPINRGVEISDYLVTKQIFSQMSLGLAIRQALLTLLIEQ